MFSFNSYIDTTNSFCNANSDIKPTLCSEDGGGIVSIPVSLFFRVTDSRSDHQFCFGA